MPHWGAALLIGRWASRRTESMGIATVVLSILLAAAFAMAGASKIAGVAQMRESATHLKVPWSQYRLIGVAEVAGAAGLLIGLAVHFLGALAAICLALLMAGAVLFHRRASDPPAAMAPAAALLVLSLVLVVLRISTF